jgi:DNA-binding NarL/FixJ family response regulator/class 3 adenylate cyclase
MAGTTTIVFTDVVGSTEARFRVGDAAATHEITEHLDLLRGCVNRAGGRVAKTLGDGAMALFDSAYDGVRAAISIQQAVRRTAPTLEVRVGVHVGDVDDVGDDVFGAAVVVAKRLCDLAGPGQILASQVVVLLIGNRADVSSSPFGRHELHGVPDEIDIVEIGWEPIEIEAPRVIVADDSPLIRTGIVHLLAAEGYDVVAEADDHDSLCAAIDSTPADLVITDIRMPPDHRDEGLRAAAHLHATRPGPAVLVLSQYIEAGAAADLLDAPSGGVGYLLKERVGELDEFLDAVRRVRSGESVIDPLVTEQLVGRRRQRDALARLTDREREVLDLMAQGLNNHAIGAQLHLSAKTVETHVGSIFTKLDLPGDESSNRRVRAVVQWLREQPGEANQDGSRGAAP